MSSLVVVPAVSIAGVFALLCRQLAGHCGPGSETCPNPATSDSAHPPSEKQPTAGPFGRGLLGRETSGDQGQGFDYKCKCGSGSVLLHVVDQWPCDVCIFTLYSKMIMPEIDKKIFRSIFEFHIIELKNKTLPLFDFVFILLPLDCSSEMPSH